MVSTRREEGLKIGYRASLNEVSVEFSQEERRKILKKLIQRLPRIPLGGWGKERLINELGLADKDWRKILKVMLEVAKGVELRKPDLPIIKYGNGGYCLVGSTDKNGHWRLF